jgi:hypothetical protein
VFCPPAQICPHPVTPPHLLYVPSHFSCDCAPG